MTDDECSDEDLVRQFRAGDDRAFGCIIRRHQDRVYRLAAVWLYDPQQAADVAQEVFLRAHKGLQSFRFRAAVFTWLYRTTRHVCNEHNRKRRHEPFDEDLLQIPGPTADLHRQQTVAKVRSLVRQLPERQRDALLLRQFEGLSVKDTAHIMGCREGTVKALLHKAMASLKSKLESIDE